MFFLLSVFIKYVQAMQGMLRCAIFLNVAYGIWLTRSVASA